MSRHLIYYLTPLLGAEAMWQWNLRMLQMRLSAFDGRRILAVATGPECVPLQSIQDRCSDAPGVEILSVTNDAELRETAHFPKLLSEILPDEGITFFAHSKGVTRKRGESLAVRFWSAAMYESLLDYPELVDRALANHVFLGAYKRYGHFPNLGSREACPWHYTGTFFWLNNERVRDRDWNILPRHRFGVEAWPALVASDAEAASLLPDKSLQSGLYQADAWRRHLWPEFLAWRRRHLRFQWQGS